MYELVPLSGNPYSQSPVPARKKSPRGIIRKAHLDALEQDVDAALTARAMVRTALLDDLRLSRARSDELNALLFEQEAAFARMSVNKIQTRNSPLGGW